MSKVRIAIGVSLSVLCAGLLAPVVARACTVATNISLGSQSGTPGSQVLVFGGAFADAPVDVSWAATGAILARVHGPNFDHVAVTIPADAKPGHYFIHATDNTGPIEYVPATFTVTAARAQVSTTTPPDPGTTATTPPTTTPPTTTPPTTTTTTTPPSATSTTPSATAPAVAPTSLGTLLGGVFQSLTPAGSSSVNSPAAPETRGSSAGSTPASSGGRLAALRPAPAALSTQGSPAAAQGNDRSDSRVLGDLWGGFVKGGTASSHAPGLLPSPAGNFGAGLAAALLVAGLVALAAGFGVMEIRRPRAAATSS